MVNQSESQTLDGAGNPISSRATNDPVQATDRGLVVQVGASALPSGAATEATQSTQNTRIGDITETAPASDTASSGLNGRLQRIAQRLTSLIALLPASIGKKSIAGSLSVVQAEADRSYSAASTAVASAANATDIFTITGAAGVVVRVKRISISGIATADANVVCVLLKRSTANTAGTSTTPTVVSYDNTNAAATAVVRSYTANPTVGTLVGNLNSVRLGVGAAAPGNGDPTQARIVNLFESQAAKQDIVLRGTAEVLAINLNGVTIAGSSFSCRVEWTEE